jgi:hypothetical protein
LRITCIDEAKAWAGTHDSPKETWIYEVDRHAIGAHKPGKEADPNRTRVNPFDMLPVIRDGEEVLSFDSGFGDIFRALYDIGSSNRQTSDEEATRLFGALIFRMGWALDHRQESDGRTRLNISGDVRMLLDEMPPQRIRTPSLHHDLPVLTILYFLEVLALNEDTKYFARNGGLKGSQGRTNTMQTCAGALACGLRLDHPMNFAYRLSRGNGVAGMSRNDAVRNFPALDNS